MLLRMGVSNVQISMFYFIPDLNSGSIQETWCVSSPLWDLPKPFPERERECSRPLLPNF